MSNRNEVAVSGLRKTIVTVFEKSRGEGGKNFPAHHIEIRGKSADGQKRGYFSSPAGGPAATRSGRRCSAHPDPPAVGIVTVAILEGLELVEEAARELAGLAVVDHDIPVAVAELTDGRDDRGRT